MKPIMINMNEMSDSREVYDSRPNRALPVFLYTCLALCVAAVLWMCLGKIDIAVNASGMIRPDETVNTVVNTVAGEVISLHTEGGSSVEAGDLLYVIDHEELLTQKEFYEEQTATYSERLSGLETYLLSVEEEKNHFTDRKSEYATRYESFQIQLDAMRLELATDAKTREYNETYLREKSAYYEKEIENIGSLLEAVQNGKTDVASGEENVYMTKYRLYLSDKKALELQYAERQQEIEAATGTENLVNTVAYYTGMKEGLETLIASVESGESGFEKKDTGLYANMFSNYLTKRQELKQSYEHAEELYKVNQALEEIAVSAWEVEESRLALEQAKAAYENHQVTTMTELQGQLQEVTVKLEEVLLSQSAQIEKDTLLKQNEEACETTLQQQYFNFVMELQTAYTAAENNLQSVQGQLTELMNAGSKVLVYENGEETEYASVSKYKNDEIVATKQSIDSCETALREVNTQLTGILQSIESCHVKAPCKGVINMIQEPVVGNTVAAGTEVCSILPKEETGYKCVIYVENEDVGGLKVGMPVKFNIYSYPNTEYGYVYGTLMKVSEDIRVDSGSGMAYYQAEATVDVGNFVDAEGLPISLKAGMACEAKIITGEKRIADFVLEKLNLLVSK